MASPIKLKLRNRRVKRRIAGTGSGLSIGGGPVITRESMGMHIGRIDSHDDMGDYSVTAAEKPSDSARHTGIGSQGSVG